MEMALVSVATGVLKPVLGKLATLLGDEYKRFKDVHMDIKTLTRELAAMDVFLLKMSKEEDPDAQDKVWMNEVRELSYDMEDAIDDFLQHVDDMDTKPYGFMEKIKSSLGKMKARRRIGSEILDLKKQIIEVGDRNARYKTGLAISNTKNTNVDPRALAIFEHASKLIGIDEPKAELIKLLTEEDGCVSTQLGPKIVSIVGYGGMGKTTLANQVYQELKGYFECQAFLSVSRNPDMMNILRTILSEVGNEGYANTEAGSIQTLIRKINDSLLKKRYFVVVDDIWDMDTWDIIKCVFPMNCYSSIIITTTRMNNVAHSCRSSFNGHIYNIRPLDMVHSRQLFHRRLFKSKEDCPSYLEKVSELILKKCDGLPLAIIAIAGLLANKERRQDLWNQVKDSIGRVLERNPSVEGMIKILSLSYFDLPPHLKTCLLYMSIYPEDAFIKKKGLIRRWIAEGFIHKEGIYTLYELGEMCFNELLNRNLIQPVETNEHGNVISCRVHDTILDFLISKSNEENFVTLVGIPSLTVGTQRKIRRLSVQGSKQRNLIIPTTDLLLSHVRSLNVFGFSLEIPDLDQFRHLRVMDFGGCYQLENYHIKNIGRLFQLKYLNLRKTRVSELPEQIRYLGLLEMLDLRDTEVGELPESVVNLGKLSHLLVDQHVKFPDGIVKMQALEMLKYVSVFWQTFNFLEELGQLKNLMSLVLDFRNCFAGRDGVLEECYKAIASSFDNIGTHNFLRSLTILNGRSFLQQGPLCPMPLTLQKLVVSRTSAVLRVPKWMGSLVNLQQLCLYVKGVDQESLCILGGLPTLLILHLTEAWPLKDGLSVAASEKNDRLIVSGEVGFRCLRQFHFNNRQSNLIFAAGAMPTLEQVWIFIHVDKSECVRSSGAYDFGMGNLPCLVTVKCTVYGFDMGIIEASKAAMERATSTHPNHPTLLFKPVTLQKHIDDDDAWLPIFPTSQYLNRVQRRLSTS